MIVENNFLAVPNEFWNDSKCLDISEKLIYLFLASFCFEEKTICWPTQETIASGTGLSLRTVNEKLKMLQIKDVIKVGHATDVAKSVDTRQHYYSLVDWTGLANIAHRDTFPKRTHKKKGANGTPCSDGALCTNKGEPFAPERVSPLPTKNTSNKTIERTQLCSALPRRASQDSDSSDCQDQPNAQEGKVRESSKAWNYRYKPRALKIILAESDRKLKNAIYGWFSGNTKEPYKYKKELEKATDLESLAKAFRYINYWEDNYIGHGTLGDFVNNTEAFAERGETVRLFDQLNFCRDNRERLVEDFIHENGLYDVTNRANRKRMIGMGLTRIQKLYYDSANTLFVFIAEDGGRRLRAYQTDGFHCVTGGEYFDDLRQLKAEVFEAGIAKISEGR